MTCPARRWLHLAALAAALPAGASRAAVPAAPLPRLRNTPAEVDAVTRLVGVLKRMPPGTKLHELTLEQHEILLGRYQRAMFAHNDGATRRCDADAALSRTLLNRNLIGDRFAADVIVLGKRAAVAEIHVSWLDTQGTPHRYDAVAPCALLTHGGPG